MFRFLATTGSFFAILGLYFLYGWIAVPKLLPEPERSPEVVGPTLPGGRDDLDPYRDLFAPTDWEMEPDANIQLLAVGRTVVLFKKDHVEGKIATLKPCTLILLPDEETPDDPEKIRQSIVLRTPEYAEIEFEEELNFSKFPLPKMQGGRLFGQVTVASDMKEPGPHDDLFLETENVAFTDAPAQTTISTLRDVRFRFGYNTGEGTMLRLQMGLSNPKNPKSPKTLNLVQFETLKRLNLFFPEESTAVAASPKSAPAAGAAKVAGPLKPLASEPIATVSEGRHHISLPAGPATKIDITCQREFSFQPAKEPKNWIASFLGNVEVVRTNPDDTQDFLTAEELSINFQPKLPSAGTPAKKTNTSAADQFGDLEPVKMLAKGRLMRGDQPAVPARLTSPQSGGVVMQGDQILYDLRANLLTLETEKLPGASKEVQMSIQNRYHIRGETGFRYEMGADGAFGKLQSQGKGSLRGNLGDEKEPKNVLMTWNAMLVEPDKRDPKQLLVHLYDGIFVDMEGLGKMSAAQMQLWCVVENKKPPLAGTPASAKEKKGALPGQMGANPLGGGTLVPDRAFVMDRVHFENASGTCDVKRLDIFFETIDSATQQATQSRWTPQIISQTTPQRHEETSRIVFASAVPNTIVPSADSPIRLVQHVEAQPTASRPLTPLTSQAPKTPAPAVRPAQQVPATNSVYSQNLLGFQSSKNGRSMYAITGDQMIMKVQRDEKRSLVEQVVIIGNVRVIEKVVDVSEGDLVEITGDRIHIWNPSSPEMVVIIKGKIPNDAVFQGKGVRINAMEMDIRRATNQVIIDGPGRLLAEMSSRNAAQAKSDIPGPGATSLVPLDRRNPGEDNRLLVEWNEQMVFDGKTILFKGVPDRNGGRVRAYYQNQRVVCNKMVLHLNRAVSLFDDTSEEPIDAEVLECVQEVYVQNRQLDEKGELRSFDRAEFDAARIMLKSNLFYASGPGVLRSTFKKSDKGFAGAKNNPLGGKALQLGEADELAFLSVWFHDDVQGNYMGEQKNIEIRGRPVRVAYCPVAGWDDEIDVNNINAAARCGYLLFCERLLISQMPDPINPEKSSMELSAIDNAIVEGEGNNLYGKAQAIRYTQAKSLVVLEGDAKVNSNGTKITGQRIEHNIETGMSQLSHTGGLNFTP